MERIQFNIVSYEEFQTKVVPHISIDDGAYPDYHEGDIDDDGDGDDDSEEDAVEQVENYLDDERIGDLENDGVDQNEASIDDPQDLLDESYDPNGQSPGSDASSVWSSLSVDAEVTYGGDGESDGSFEATQDTIYSTNDDETEIDADEYHSAADLSQVSLNVSAAVLLDSGDDTRDSVVVIEDDYDDDDDDDDAESDGVETVDYDDDPGDDGQSQGVSDEEEEDENFEDPRDFLDETYEPDVIYGDDTTDITFGEDDYDGFDDDSHQSTYD